MDRNSSHGPQESLFFRVIAFFAKLQLRYLLQTMGNPRFLVVIFVFIAGTTALGIITMAAYLTELPLLFPPLGPSAFILFHTPLSVAASPRSVILSHTLAVAAGLLSLWLIKMLYPAANLSDPSVLNLCRVMVIALSMGLVGIIMVAVGCVHPPAAASALIAAMGYLHNATQALGLLGAVALLVLNAFFFNRILGGLPYPVWRADPNLIRSYGSLAGIPDVKANYWRQMEAKIFQRR